MDVKLSVLVLVALGLLVDNASADLFFNRSYPGAQELESLNLKCLPGRTVIKVTERQRLVEDDDDDSDEFTRSKPEKSRRFYQGTDLDERCSMCICSVDGQSEVCLKRPAGTVNECIVMDSIKKNFDMNLPYEIDKNMAYRIRRDLIWHNDEIPYDPSSRCYRGHSYYTNHDTPNDTNINYDDDVNSLLDFKSQTACFFCVCSVSGKAAGCISRSLWFCNYLRYLRSDKSGRDMYANMFQQDRPAYFRQLSWRLRRTMDTSMFDLVEQVGGDQNDQEQKEVKEPKTCVPFVSEYTDCNTENECLGCTKCSCSAAGLWECQPVRRCDRTFETDKIDEELLDAAIDKLDNEKKVLNDRMRHFYAGLNSKGKKYKALLSLGAIGKKTKGKRLRAVEMKKKTNLKNIYKEKTNLNRPRGTVENKHHSNLSMGSIKDISNESTQSPEVIDKEDSFNKSVTNIQTKEHSNGTVSSVSSDSEKKGNTTELAASEENEYTNRSVNTIKENSNESTEQVEKKDDLNDSKETRGSAEKTANSTNAIDSAEQNDKSNSTIELKTQKLRSRLSPSRYVPLPPKKEEKEDILDMINSYKPAEKLREIFSTRPRRSTVTKNAENKHHKRSTDKAIKNRHPRNSNINNTVKFYSTVDELNEDTLKHSNLSGTLHARKVELNVLPDISRRSNTNDYSSNKSLHIDFNHPTEFNHITDNKIDNIVDHDNKMELAHEKLSDLIGNHTQKTKDKKLSKLVVNELNTGTEIIGDKIAPVTSNITFTSENDTLTAMAFIAGNLLNKLWNMEKDATGFILETEDMKYEKISDLLELFKEPLNLRQEAFLKNALEQLSNAIDRDRDIKNVTICQTIEEATKLLDAFNNTDDEDTPNATVTEQTPCKKDNSSTKEKSNKHATLNAISKINTVLELMKKFENIQKNISLLKNESVFNFMRGNNSTKPISNKMITDSTLTKDETSSLNVFGNILNKITKMLLPKKSNRKMANIIKDKNILNNDQNVRNNLMKMHNIDLKNMTMTAKDKIIVDYITHINSNPDCILNKNHQNMEKSLPSIEGNILLNLSEFFKMKSFADLIHLLQPEKQIKKNANNIPVTTKMPMQSITDTVESTTISSLADKSKKFASTKDKLKAHLKSIIEDLIELQNSKGIVTRSNIRIADALPCIYKIMNAGKDVPIKTSGKSNSPERIVDIFNTLKQDMKIAQTRRSDSIMQVRPKSAVVLERVIKNFVEKSKVQTRRFASLKASKPADELKKIMNKLQNVSSVYKNQALYDEVPAAEKLVLLRALEEDVRNHIIVLEGIKRTFPNLKQLPADQYEDFAKFIDNSAKNISLDAKVIKKVEKLNIKNKAVDEIDNSNHIPKDILPRKSFAMHSGVQEDSDNMKISRNQILNHLIANRMKIYIKLKEAKEFDLSNDMNYNIAKRVLFYLDSGNHNLAHELFKMLVMQKQDKLGISAKIDRTSEFIVPTPKTPAIIERQDAMPRFMPMMQLDIPTTPSTQMKWMSQDHLIKQLLNIKNMGL